MKNTRSMIALVVAVVCGLVAAKMVSTYLHDKQPPQSQTPVRIEKALPKTETRPVFTQRIPPGLRAVSIPVDEVTGVSREITPGDMVDVIVVSPAPDNKNGNIARLLLEAVEVLASAQENLGIGNEEVMASSRQARKWVVTLLLSPENAALVAAADASGKLVLSVRHPGDPKPVQKDITMGFNNTYGGGPYQKMSDKMMPDVRGLIAPGMRAFTLEIREIDAAGGQIKPGDRVDVMLTCPFGHFSTKGGHDVGVEGKITSTHMASRIFLQNIEILAVVDQERVVTQRSPIEPDLNEVLPVDASLAPIKAKFKLVILHVTPEDAELLTVATDATSASTVRLLLRNPLDTARVNTKGQLLIELLTEKREYTNVELVVGNEQMVKKFFQYTKGGIATRSEKPAPDTQTENR